MIDKSLDPSSQPPSIQLDDESFDFQPMESVEQDPQDLSVAHPDGSMTINLSGQEDVSGEVAFGDNLAEHLSSTDLMKISGELIPLIDADKRSRKDWEKAYMDGLEFLGMKIEERQEPWPGASGVYHPLLTEAVVRFQAQTMTEIFPAAGPARTQIIGEESVDIVKRAKRVETELNYLVTEKMTEFRSETEAMLFRLPLAGSAFKKVWFDRLQNRPVSVFVPAEDLIVQYGASNLESCERYCHVMKKSENEVKKLIQAGLYVDQHLSVTPPISTDVERAHSKLSGEQSTWDADDRFVLYEVHVDIDLPEPFSHPEGIACPHIITIEKNSQKILAIYRNWQESDQSYKKIMHFVHYPYMPGMGFYGMGLIHLMGGLQKVQHQSSDNSSTPVPSRISQGALRLVDFVSGETINLLCLASGGMWIFPADNSKTPCFLCPTRNHRWCCINCSETSSMKGEGSALLRISKSVRCRPIPRSGLPWLYWRDL